MGLYLCIFEGDEEVDGVERGGYADFGDMCDYIVRELEGGKPGARFPVFSRHSDCDGEWAAFECEPLAGELARIATELKARPAIPFVSEWQAKVAKSIGRVPQNAFESFLDVDGEPAIERLQGLVEIARTRRLPILFQ
jgi:hypothetical protein